MRIGDGNERVVVGDNREVAQSSEKEMALLHGPANCQAFQLDSSVSAFCANGEESQASLHNPPVRVAVGWLLVSRGNHCVCSEVAVVVEGLVQALWYRS